jgi:hypothetical protein
MSSSLWRIHLARFFLALPAWRLFNKLGPAEAIPRVCMSKISQSLVSQSIYYDRTEIGIDPSVVNRVAHAHSSAQDRLPFIDITDSIEATDILAVLKSVFATGVMQAVVEYYAGSFYVDKLQFIRTRAVDHPSQSELWHLDCNDAESIHFVYCFSPEYVEPGFGIAINSSHSLVSRFIDKIIIRRVHDHKLCRDPGNTAIITLDKPGGWLVFNPSRLWHKLHTRNSSSVYLLLTFCSRHPYFPPSRLSPKVSEALRQALSSESGTLHLAECLSSIAFLG